MTAVIAQPAPADCDNDCRTAKSIEALNRTCYCLSLDEAALRNGLEADLGRRGLSHAMMETHPHLFASDPLFFSREHVERMAGVVSAVEALVATPRFRLAALRRAYLAGEVVVSPHPRAHALYADKRNLTLLCDEALLRETGIADEALATLLAAVPRTTFMTDANRDALWTNRRALWRVCARTACPDAARHFACALERKACVRCAPAGLW